MGALRFSQDKRMIPASWRKHHMQILCHRNRCCTISRCCFLDRLKAKLTSATIEAKTAGRAIGLDNLARVIPVVESFVLSGSILDYFWLIRYYLSISRQLKVPYIFEDGKRE